MSGLREDEEILAAFLTPATKAAAFSALFTRHRERVFTLAFHITRARADAEDATQETFLAVHRGLAQFRGESALSTWIYRIASRTALRIAMERRAKRADVWDDAYSPAVKGGQDDVTSRDHLTKAWHRLSLDHQMVLSLFAVDGLTHREIADILAVPEGTVWSRLHHARTKFASALG
jgi:RNA polymerase sigma-70 factor, ECF subfamily